jgi:hypothetical protein
MLAVMGLMVGFYIITKMMEIISARYHQPKVGVTGFMAVITILVTLCAMLYFVFGPSVAAALR